MNESGQKQTPRSFYSMCAQISRNEQFTQNALNDQKGAVGPSLKMFYNNST